MELLKISENKLDYGGRYDVINHLDNCLMHYSCFSTRDLEFCLITHFKFKHDTALKSVSPIVLMKLRITAQLKPQYALEYWFT